jgi:hypothetical protein
VKRFDTLLVVGAFPVLLATLLDWVLRPYTTGPNRDIFTDVLCGLLHSIPWVIFAVPWHRWILLNEKPTVRKTLEWSHRHSLFVLFSFLTYFPLAVTQNLDLGNVLNPLLQLIAFAGCIFVYIRLSLVLPATASDASYNLSHAWNLSRGYTLPITLALGLAFAVFVLLGTPVFYVLIEFPNGPPTVVLAKRVLANTWYLVSGAVFVSTLSFTYQCITEEKKKGSNNEINRARHASKLKAKSRNN